MAKDTGATELQRAASDPSTPRADLADLAYDHPELRVAIALNPATYRGLLTWLRELGDPHVNAALDERENGVTRPTAPVPRAKSISAAPTVESAATAPQADTCAECDAPIKLGANYCGACGTPVPGAVVYVPPAADAGSNRAIVYSAIGVAAFIVLVVIGIGAAQAVTSLSGQADASQNAAPNGSAGTGDSGDTTSSSGSQDTQTDQGSSTDSTQAPAQVDSFRSTSGNITCRITPQAVICHQTTIKYAIPSSACRSGIAGVTVGVDADGATWPCIDSSIAADRVLPYDQPVSEWGYTCLIDYTTGVRCSNQDNDGFTMNYTRGVSTF